MLVEVEENGCVRTRSKSYLLALLLGAWVLSTEWLTACEQQGTWVEEASFLVKVSRGGVPGAGGSKEMGLGGRGGSRALGWRRRAAGRPGSRVMGDAMALPPV